jgi:hypothetical protein
MTNRVRSSLAGWITAGEDARRAEMCRAETRPEEACPVRAVATWAPDAGWSDFDE